MMDGFTVSALLTAGAQFGLPGLFFVLWYWSDRRYARLIDELRRAEQTHQAEVSKILVSYKEDAAEARRMYENNVVLLKQTQSVTDDLKDIVIMNTQAWQSAHDKIESVEKDIDRLEAARYGLKN